MSELAKKHCVPCRGGIPPLEPEQQRELHGQLGPGWEIVEHHHLRKAFAFPDFVTGLAFVNRVAEVAEEEGHHPDLLLKWGRVVVEIWTHKIDGLTLSDFVLAAKCDEALPAP